MQKEYNSNSCYIFFYHFRTLKSLQLMLFSYKIKWFMGLNCTSLDTLEIPIFYRIWTESNEGSENLKLFISLHDLFNFQTL